LDLIALPRDLEAYVKVDGWLYQKPCKDLSEQGGDATDRVLGFVHIIAFKGKQMGFIVIVDQSDKMEDDDCGWKEKWTCDMVLCVPCYEQRNNKMDVMVTKEKQQKDCA
jgi:hypothetical protein